MSDEEALERVLSGKSWEEFCDTLKAAGWLVVAAHHLMKKARLAQYRLAAEWLGTVRTVSEAIGQSAAFQRTLDAFKDRYRRRKSLLRILDEAGL